MLSPLIDKTKCDNYRVISLFVVTSTLFTRVIVNRIQKLIDGLLLNLNNLNHKWLPYMSNYVQRNGVKNTKLNENSNEQMKLWLTSRMKSII